jgi:cell division protein FtsB
MPAHAPAAQRRASARVRSGSRSAAARGGIRWDRLSRLALLAVLAAVLLSYIGPAHRYFEAWRLSGKTRAEIQALRADNDRLRERARALRDPRRLELEARRLGMARPGERAYVVRGLP